MTLDHHLARMSGHRQPKDRALTSGQRERCPTCGQPDNCGECNHRPLTAAECELLQFDPNQGRP